MPNAAYSFDYQQRMDECLTIFTPANLVASEEHPLGEGLVVKVDKYEGEFRYPLYGSRCCLLNSAGRPVASWHSIDNNADFYRLIKHSNGHSYLLFRQDLYGYSVLDIATGLIHQFFPQHSLDGGETFIWVDVAYNPSVNLLAVSGCYWACPYSVQLFTFDEPTGDNPRYVDLGRCFNAAGDEAGYEDIDFVKWENSDLHISRLDAASGEKSSLIISREQYLSWLDELGQEL